MGSLGRGPHRQHLRAGVAACQNPASLERNRSAAVEIELLLDHMRCLRERSICVAVGHRHARRDIIGEVAVDRRSVGPCRGAAVAHRRQHVVIDRHRRGSVLGDIAGFRDHHRDALPDIADFLACQRRLRTRRLDQGIRHQHWNLAARHRRRQVIGSQHGMNAWHGARGSRVDRANFRMRVGAAHETGVQHSGKSNVTDETSASGEQGRVFEARDAGAEMLRAHGLNAPEQHNTALGRYTESIALQSRAIVP